MRSISGRTTPSRDRRRTRARKPPGPPSPASSGSRATPGPTPHLIERLRSAYDQRLRRASPLAAADDDVSARTQAAYRRLVHEALEAERRALVALRDRGVISDEVLHRLEQELDVEAMRIGLGEARLPD